MTGSRWKKGDLGRFRAESDKAPRFELIGVNKDRSKVGVWYGGENKVQTIPIETFRKECVNWWSVRDAIPRETLPRWLKENQSFFLTPGGRHVVQARIEPQQLDYRYRNWKAFDQVTIDVGPEELRIRSVRYDFASCLLVDRKSVILLPVKNILTYGYQVQNAWDRVEADPFNEVDEDLKLFDGWT